MRRDVGSGPVLHYSLGQPTSNPAVDCMFQDSNAAPLLPEAVEPAPLYVNIERGAEPASMQEGFIPSSMVSFERALSKPLHPSAIATPYP
jgi:hypothetical protein